jgi:hypothetical protein
VSQFKEGLQKFSRIGLLI